MFPVPGVSSMSNLPASRAESGVGVTNISSLINNAFTSSLGGTAYRVKWNPAFNNSWIMEDCDGICTRSATETLFETLRSSKEVITNPSKPVLNQNATLPDYDFDKPTMVEQKRYLLSQLNSQMELAQAVCLESPFFSLLRKRLLITHRILYGIYSRFHDGASMQEILSSTKLTNTPTEGSTCPMSQGPISNPTEVLIEMGLGVGLNLVFSLLRNSLSQNTDQTSLCLDVLEKAKSVIWTLPPMSLANDKKLPPLAVRSLDEVTDFLKQIVTSSSSIGICRKLGAEVILGLALQRCSLQHLLEWIQMSLSSSESDELNNELAITSSAFHAAILILHQNSENKYCEKLVKELCEKSGSDDIPIHAAALKLMEELTSLSADELKGTRTPTVTILPSSRVADISHLMLSLCTATNEQTIKLLTDFILTYGVEFSSHCKSPFQNEEERADFVILCLKLLNSQLLVLHSSETNSSMETVIVDLRSVCFKMLDMDLPSKIQKTVAETLSTGGLMLPPLNEKLKLLLGLLKDVKTLSRGQKLLCEIVLSSLEDRNRIAQMLGFSRSKKSKETLSTEELKLTEQLMASLLNTLNDATAATWSEDLKQDGDYVLHQRLHFLLTSLQNHIFSYCVCGAEIPSHATAGANNLDKIIWDMMKAHLSLLFESAVGIFKKAEDAISRNPDASLKVSDTLFRSANGSMLLRVIHSMLLPIHHNFHDLLSQLISLLISMESFTRKLPEQFCIDGSDAYQASRINQDWMWFADMEKTCSHLVGRLIGDLIRGSYISKEEIATKNWLNNRLFSFGFETSSLPVNHSNIPTVLYRLVNIVMNKTEDWENELRLVLKSEFKPKTQLLFDMILPSGSDNNEDNANSDKPYDLLMEHARSLDWDTCDAEQDDLIDSVVRLVLLAIMKHTGLATKYRSMTMSQRRQNTKLNEIFSLVFHVRTRLLMLKQGELMQEKKSADTLLQTSEHASNSASVENLPPQDLFSQFNASEWDNIPYERDRGQIRPRGRCSQPENLITPHIDFFGEEQAPANFAFGRGGLPDLRETQLQDLRDTQLQELALSRDQNYPLICARPTCTGLSATTQEMAEHVRDNMAFVSAMNQLGTDPRSSLPVSAHGSSSTHITESQRVSYSRSGLEAIRQCYGSGSGTTSERCLHGGHLAREVEIGLPVVSSATSINNIFLPRQRNSSCMLRELPRSRSDRPLDGRQEDMLQRPNSDMVQNENGVTSTGVKVADPNSRTSPECNSYKMLAQGIVERSLLLLLFVKPSMDESQRSHISHQSTAQQSTVQLDEFYTDEFATELPTVKSSDTFPSPESRRHTSNSETKAHDTPVKDERPQVDDHLLVRKLGRNVVRFVAWSLIESKHEWFTDNPSGVNPSSSSTTRADSSGSHDGWMTDPPLIIEALKKHEERARERIGALCKILGMVSPVPGSTGSEEVGSNDYLVSVHEFFIAGCFQLGISSPIQINVKPDAVILVMSNTDTSVCHYLDGVHASPIALQAQVIKSVHEIMSWMISTLKSLMDTKPISNSSSICPLHSRSDDSETEDIAPATDRNKVSTLNKDMKNDEVKLLNLFTLSCRFNPNDVKLVVQSGLLRILENFNSFEVINEDNHKYPPSLLFGKYNQDIKTSPFANYVSTASMRLLHMISVATAIHAHKLEDEVIEKVVDVLYTQLVSLLTSLCGSHISIDGESSPTPTGTPDTPLVSMSPISDSEQHNSAREPIERHTPSPLTPLPTSAERLEIETRIADYLIFLRRLVGEHSMARFFCKTEWIKLILSFLSVKPCNDVETFLRLEEEEELLEEMCVSPSSSNLGSPSNDSDQSEQDRSSNQGVNSDGFGLRTSRNILFTAGLRPRLLAIQFLESLLINLPPDCSDLKEITAKDLMHQLSDAMWTIPMYERAKKNMLHREEITKNNGELRFDPEKCACCFTENGGQTLVHGRGGRGVGLANISFTSGCHQWKFLIVKENKGNEGVCVGVSKWPIRDHSHRSTEDMYLYRAYSGNLYNKGEMPFGLPNYTQGDCITCILDFDNKTISFGKNHEEPVLAFQNVEAKELYPCVLFYSTNPGEKVKIIDYEPRTNDRTLLAGEPYCAPLAATLAESYVALIRALHSTNDGWAKAVNDSMMERLYNGKDTLYDSGGDKTPTPALSSPAEAELGNEINPEEPTAKKGHSLEEIERLCREVWPVLAVMGGIDRGLRIGMKCLNKANGKRAIILGSQRTGLSTVRVQWDDTESGIGDTPVSGLEPIQMTAFDVARFTCITAETLRFLTKLSGITDEIRFPLQDQENNVTEPSPNQPSVNEENEGEHEDEDELITCIKCIQDEGTELSFWQPPLNSRRWRATQGSGPSTTIYSNTGNIQMPATVDAISDRMVTDIISEVTRKSSEECGRPAELSHEKSTECMVEKSKAELELESSFVRLALIQFGAMKALSAIFSCNHFAEFILVPKKPKPPKAGSLSENKEKESENEERVCPKCDKSLPPDDDECPCCAELSGFQTALAETFQQFVSVSVKPCRLAKLVPLSDVERIQTIIHDVHYKQLVDSIGPRFALERSYFGDSSDDVGEAVRTQSTHSYQTAQQQVVDDSPRPPCRRRRDAESSSSSSRPGSLVPVTLAGLAGRVQPSTRISGISQEVADFRNFARCVMTSDEDPRLRSMDLELADDGVENSTFGHYHSGSGRTLTRNPCIRRRTRRSPSPPPPERVTSRYSGPGGRGADPASGRGRIPPTLLEMGFTPGHIRQAMTALGIGCSDPSVPLISQLASWMIENPSIEQEERDHRFVRPWSLSLARAESADEQVLIDRIDRRRQDRQNQPNSSSPLTLPRTQNHPTAFAHQVVMERLTFQEALNRNQASKSRTMYPSSNDQPGSFSRAPNTEVTAPAFKIPVVNMQTLAGERGLCCFCSNLEQDVGQHFLTKHRGCGFKFSDGSCCGEIRGTNYYLCCMCYDQHGARVHRFVEANPVAVTDYSLALPPLTMTPNNPEEDFSVNTMCPPDMVFETSSAQDEVTDTFTLLLPYLGLRKAKPFPNFVHLKDSDVLGGDIVDRVVGSKSKSSAGANAATKVFIEQAMTLNEPKKRIEALESTTEFVKVMIARNVVLKVLTLLSISDGSCDMGAALANVGLSDVKKLIKLMCLTASERLLPNSPGEEGEDENRFYNPGSNRFALYRFSNLPYDVNTCTKLHHIGKAVETLIINETEAAKSVLDLCTKELIKASVGFVDGNQTTYENSQLFVVIISLVNLLCSHPFVVETESSRAPRTPQSPNETQDFSLLLLDALAMAGMSALFNHRQWAIEQLVSYLLNRAAAARVPALPSTNFTDMAGAMTKCETLDIIGHDNRVTCLKWLDERHQLCTAGGYEHGGTVRTYSFFVENKTVQPETVLMFQKPRADYENSESGEIISNLAWSSSGTFLAASMNYSVNIWILDGSDPTKCHVDEHPALITVVAFPKIRSPIEGQAENLDFLLVGRVDGSVALVPVSTTCSFPMRDVLPSHSGSGVSFIDWPRSDGYFAVGFFDGLIKFSRKDANYKAFSQRAHLGCLTGMMFDPSGETLISCGDDKVARIWVESINENMPSTSSYYWLCAQEIELDNIPVSLTWSPFVSNSPYPNLAAFGMNDGTVTLWLVKSFKTSIEDTQDKVKLVQSLRSNPFYPVTSLAINPTGTILATGNSKGNGLVNFWSIQHGILLYTYCGAGGVQEICWMGDALACCFTRSREVKLILYNDHIMSKNIVFAACRKALLEQGLNGFHTMPALKALFSYLPHMLQEQYLYEKPKVDSGDHLLHSRYLQSLATLALNLGLDKILTENPAFVHDNGGFIWDWLNSIGIVTGTANALINRTEFPKTFVEKFQVDESASDAAWTLEMDEDIINWATQQPHDWQYGGKIQVFMFGAGRHGQLGDAGRNLNTPKLAQSFQGTNQVVCGQNCTFLIQSNGTVSSLGEGSYGRLGHGNSDDLQTQSVISALSGYTIVQLATSTGSDGHSAAITDSGEIFTWGDGDYGKLGLGSTERHRRPKQVDFLKHEKIVQVATGWKHTCCINEAGVVFVFGSGELGRLGLGVNTGNKKYPEKIASLENHKIGFVSCGLAHTVCVSNDGCTVWSFGDGENGKLGLGSVGTVAAPHIVESLNNIGIVKVGCGSQFTVFLTKGGRVFTCGLDKFTAQTSGRSCTLRPTQVMALSDKFVVDIAVGAEYTLCATQDNEVYGWGNNGEGQLGLGHTLYQKEPERIKLLSGKGIQQVSAGRTHSAAWTAPRQERGQDTRLLLGSPATVPAQYPRLHNFSTQKIRSRLKLLHSFSDLLFKSWKFLPLIAPVGCTPNENEPGFAPTHGKLRTLLTPRVTNLPFIRTLCRTMMQQRTYGPTITVRRIAVRGKKKKPIFTQISKQVMKLQSHELRLSSRAWKVKLVGEGADDAGGVFDDTITEMCIELANGTLPYLISCPNASNDVGYNRDRFLLNPDLTSSEDLMAFKFIGILLGVAIRTKKPVAIPLAAFIWKILVGQEVTIDDLEEIDSMYIQGLKSIKDNVSSQFDEETFHDVFPLECYEGTSSTGKIVPIVSGGRSIPLTFHNRLDYIEKAIHFRLHEMDLQVAALREGLSDIIPVPLLSLMTGSYLEQLICGLPDISISLLKQVVRYREMDETHELVRWLWEILEEFSNAERVLFMRFVSGRSRLPANVADFSQRFQVMRVDRPVNGLPTSQTCFFQLRLPPYSSKEKMSERLRYAINNCTCIDMDNYMLARNNGFELEDEDDDVEIIG